jgi:integrase
VKYREWLKQWLELYASHTTKERTYQKYKKQVELHILPALGHYEMEEMDAVVLQRFAVALTDKGLAANTINGVISVLRQSLKRAVLSQVAEREWTDCIVRPKMREKQVECFTKEEQRKIEKYLLDSQKTSLVGVILCLYTGLRIGELLALQWKSIDFSKGMLYVKHSCHDSWVNGEYRKVLDTPKTENSVRVIPLPKQLLPYLKAMKKQAKGDFVVDGKTPYGAQMRTYQRAFENLLIKLKIPHKGFHALRHTFATRALECGMDVKTLSEILGHKNPTITLNRYAHSLLEHKAEMMNKLGKLLQQP